MSLLSGGLDSAAKSADASSRSTGEWSSRGKALLREPLLHFLVIGMLIFAVNAVVTPSVSKERVIEVTPEVRQSIIDIFKRGNEDRREPTPDQLAPLIDVWILNEVLYREALAQGLDKGDEMIRERIIQKMRLLIYSDLDIGEPTQDELQKWYEIRREQYDIPDLVSFYEVPTNGADAEKEAKTILEQIESGTESEEVQARARIFYRRPLHSLEPAFGKPFVEALATSPIGKWQTLQSPVGWHVVRVDAFHPGRKVPLNEVATQALAQWKDERSRRLGTAAVRNLTKSYVVRQVP